MNELLYYETDDGVLGYKIEGTGVVQVDILRMPTEPYTIRFPRKLKGRIISEIGCANDLNVICTTDATSEVYHKYGSDIFSIEIDDRIETIHNRAFAGTCAKSLHWPSSCKIIPADCFSYSHISKFTGLGSVVNIMDRAFRGADCTSYAFSEKLFHIGKNAFCQSKIKSITGLKNVWGIEEEAFAESDIEKIVWPDHCVEIPARCFSICKNLESVTNLIHVKDVGSFAFNECTNLKSIHFHEDLLGIGRGAFNYSGLTELDLSGTSVGILWKNSFEGCMLKNLKYSAACAIF